MDEYLDVVNDNDEVIGKKLRSELYAAGLSNFRVVNAFLVNSSGQIWIPRRAPTKRIFPSCLDMSMGGHVASGETYEQAFRRELLEELRIDAAIAPWKLLGNLTPGNDGVSAFMQVYELRSDTTPDFNRADFTEFFWLTPKEVLAKIAQGDQAKSDLPKLVSHFYAA